MLRSLISWFILSLSLCSTTFAQPPTSWQYAKTQSNFELYCYWFNSRPFIYSAKDGIAGIEYDLINEFAKFVKNKYGVTLTIRWVECENFKKTYDTVQRATRQNTIGATAFSITTTRLKNVQFSPPYVPDISVIVSNFGLPIAYNENEFDSIFNNLQGITIEGTTLEDHLLALKEDRGLNFSIDYTPTLSTLISKIGRTKNSFGYIDLPTYLTALQDTINVKRQFLFSTKNRGLGLVLPLTSDWIVPVNSFFSQPEFKSINDSIISQHFGKDVPYLINNIATGANISSKDEVLLLTKEKEVQSQELVDSALAIEREKWVIRVFVLGFVLLLFIAIFTYRLYRQKTHINEQLNIQKLEIEQQNSKLRMLNDDKNNIINVLAHDLKAPINNITGFANLIEMEQSEEAKRELLQRIKRSTERINSMIKKILDVEAIESEKPNLNIQPIDLKCIVTQVADSFEKNAKEKHIQLETHYDEHKTYFIKGDEIYLLQILENLVSNALKFSKQGTKVEITLTEEAKKIRCTVSDQGPGFSKEDLEKLFQKFQKLSAKPTQGEHSTGLGLSIVKKYVDVMNGETWCKSEPGQGADFIVEFEKA